MHLVKNTMPLETASHLRIFSDPLTCDPRVSPRIPRETEGNSREDWYVFLMFKFERLRRNKWRRSVLQIKVTVSPWFWWYDGEYIGVLLRVISRDRAAELQQNDVG